MHRCGTVLLIGNAAGPGLGIEIFGIIGCNRFCFVVGCCAYKTCHVNGWVVVSFKSFVAIIEIKAPVPV